MISKLSKRIAQYLADKNKIDGDEIDLYHYGLFVMISEFFLMFCSLVIGIIFKIPLQGVIFYLVFFLTHRYAGGFHAKTEFYCHNRKTAYRYCDKKRKTCIFGKFDARNAYKE